MKLNPVKYSVRKGYHFHLISENKIVELGVRRVAFGYKISAGFCDNKYNTEIDWSVGENWSDVEKLYSLIKAILSQREESLDCFKDIPGRSDMQPFYKDLNFVKTIVELAGNFNIIKLNREDVK